MKKYSIEDIDMIILERGWHSCIANNEPNFGTHTIYISEEEDLDYFGEFVGNNDDNSYIFNFYIL